MSGINLWKQFNAERSLGETLNSLYGFSLPTGSDRELYEAIKRHLTRRELKCFVMGCSGETVAEIAAETGTDIAGVEAMQDKIAKKFRRPKLGDELRRFRDETDVETSVDD